MAHMRIWRIENTFCVMKEGQRSLLYSQHYSPHVEGTAVLYSKWRKLPLDFIPENSV